MKTHRKKSLRYRLRPLYALNSTGAPLARREDCPVWERLSQSFALIMLTLFPLMLGPKIYFDLTGAKFVYFIILTGLYALLCCVVGFLYPPGRRRGLKKRERTPVRLTMPQIFLILYVLWACFSALLSPYDGLWLGQSRYEGMLSILLYSAWFLLLSFWGEYTDAYTYGLAVMGTAVGLIGMLQTFGLPLLYRLGVTYWNSAFLSTIGHEDCVACLVCLLISAMLCGFVVLEGRWRLLCLPALFFMTYIALYTDVDTAKIGFAVAALFFPCLIQSRERLQRLLTALIPILLGAALALTYHKNRSFAPGLAALGCLLAAAAFGVVSWLMRRHERSWTVRPAVIRRAAYLLLLLMLAAGLVFLYRYTGGNRLVHELSEALHGHLADKAGTLRGYIWKKTVRIIREHPVTGGGPGSFFSLFAPYREGYYDLLGLHVDVDFPHNDLLCVAACTGLVGLALYLAFLFSLALRCIRAAKRSPIMLIFLAGMAGYLAYSLFVFSIAIVTPLFWVLAGLADKLVRQTDGA